ncbi:MAG: hypothetical protein ACO3JL_02965 [Myxococcota bacterium]
MVRGFCVRFGAVPMVAVTVMTACGPDFAPSYLLTQERVLAVRAEPPEAGPGEVVLLTPLVAGPNGIASGDVTASLRWWRCDDEVDLASTDEPTCSAASRKDVLGTGGTFATTWTAAEVPTPPFEEGTGFAIAADQPLDDALLHALSGYQQKVGASLQNNAGLVVDTIKRIVVFPYDEPISKLDQRLAAIDIRLEEDGALGRNENPRLEGVEVREGTADGPLVDEILGGQSYWLRPTYDASSLQVYKVLTLQTDGLALDDPASLDELTGEQLLSHLRTEARCEVPAFSWYVTAGVLQSEGSVDEQVLLGAFAERGLSCPPLPSVARRPEVRFTAPEATASGAPSVVHGFVVMRDGRGGTDFFAFDLPLAESGAP